VSDCRAGRSRQAKIGVIGVRRECPSLLRG
jgi:hypothetical protein